MRYYFNFFNYIINMYKTSISALFVLCALSTATASKLNSDNLHRINSVSTAVPFLTIAPDSRSAGMGDVGVATTPDANSLHWNPAKYAFVKIEESVSLSYSPWLRGLVNDMNLVYLTWYKRIEEQQVIAASLRYFNMGSIEFRDGHGTSMGPPRRPNEFAIDMAYSRMFSENMSAALAFRYIRSDISAGFSNSGLDAKAGNSFAADLGMFYNSEFDLLDESGNWALGLNISNIGTKMSYSNDQYRMFIPINLRFGGSLGINLDSYNKMTFAVDLNKLLVPTPPIYDNDGNISGGKSHDVPVVQGIFQSFYDAPGGINEELREISYGFGLEYLYREVFAVRTGFFYEHPTKGNRRYFTMGAGLNMNMLDIDFSYLIPTVGQNNPLSNTLRFTVIFNFGRNLRTS